MLKDLQTLRGRVIKSNEAAEDAELQPPAKRRLFGRRDRDGLASNELVILIAVIAVLALAGTVGFLIVRAVRSGSEHSVVQQNIDQVSALGDTYWDLYADDVDGRRKISLSGFCDYVNNSVGDQDVNIRTLQIIDSAGGAVAAADLEQGTDGGAPGRFEGMVYQDPADVSTARCPASRAAIGLVYADILAKANPNSAATAVNAGAMSAASDGRAWDILTGAELAAGIAAPTPDSMKEALEAVDMLSTKTVWIAQFSDDGGTATPMPLPTGTDNTIDPTGASNTDAGAEYLVIGGVAPDGTSFCLIKVFDATDPSETGDYRIARVAVDGFGFASCLQGVTGAIPNEPRHGGGWPEPQ